MTVREETLMQNNVDIQKHMNCIQMNLAFICNSLDRDFSNLFIDSWDFYYKPNNDSFSPGKLSFKQFRKLSHESLQWQYLGMKAHEIDPKSLLSSNLIARYLEGSKALLLNISAFDCPWHRGYRKIDIDHYCLVVGLTEDGYQCTDPYLMGNRLVSLTRSQSSRGRELIFYNRLTSAARLTVDILFSEIIKNINNNNIFIMMEQFRRHFSGLPDATQLYDYPQDIYLCAITRTIKFIADGRFQLSYLIGKLGVAHPKQNQINAIYTLLNDSGNTWNHINSLIIKVFYIPRRFEEEKLKITNYLEKVIHTEKEIYSRITECL